MARRPGDEERLLSTRQVLYLSFPPPCEGQGRGWGSGSYCASLPPERMGGEGREAIARSRQN